MPGRLNIADSLSRLIKTGEAKSRNVAEDYANFVAEIAVPKAMNSREIEVASSHEELIAKSSKYRVRKLG